MNASELIARTLNPRTDLTLRAANYTALRTVVVTSMIVGTVANLPGRTTDGDGGGGLFRWDSSDLSSEVTADTQSGIYVAPDSDATGVSGAWVRILSDRTVRPEWFGTTPGAVEIQAAIDWLYNGGVSPSGGVVKLQGRTYDLNTVGITLQENIHLVGEYGASPYSGGAIIGGTWLKYNGTGNAVTIDGAWTGFDSRRNIRLADFSIELSGTPVAGISADFMTQFQIENIQVHGNGTYGVYFRNCYQGAVRNLWTVGGQTYAHYVDIDIADDVFSGQTVYTDCRFTDAATAGVHLVQSANVLAQIKFEKCLFQQNGYGLYIDKARKVVVETCHFEGNTDDHIFTTADTDRGPVVFGCKHNATALKYFLNAQGDGAIAFGNAIVGNDTAYGFLLAGENNHIYDNYIRTCANSIVIDAAAVGNEIGHHTFVNQIGDAVTDSSTSSIYTNEVVVVSEEMDVAITRSTLPLLIADKKYWVRKIQLLCTSAITVGATASKVKGGISTDDNRFFSDDITSLTVSSIQAVTPLVTFLDTGKVLTAGVFANDSTGKVRVIYHLLPWDPA